MIDYFNGDPNLDKNKKGGKIVFYIFCFMAFVLLCRPQDIFSFMSVVRPTFLVTILSCLSLLLSGTAFGNPSITSEKQLRLYIYLILLIILGIPFSLYTRQSLYFFAGVYMYTVIFSFLFFKIISDEVDLYSIIFISCLGTGLYATAAIKLGTIEYGRLVFGKMFDANDLAYYAVSFLPLNILFLGKDNQLWKRAVGLVSIISCIALILSTGSRGGAIALGSVVLLLLIRKTSSIKVYQKVIFTIILVVVASFSAVNVERYETIFNLEGDYNLKGEEGRIFLWKLGINEMLKNPIIGVGISCFSNAVGMERRNDGSESQAWQTAHNSLVQIGAETGIIGLALFLIISFNVIRIFINTEKRTNSLKLKKICEMGVVGFVGLFVSGLFLSQAYSIYWAFYVVMSATISKISKNQQVVSNC